MLWIMLTVTLPCSDGPPPPVFPLMSRDCDDVTPRVSGDVNGDSDQVVLFPRCT